MLGKAGLENVRRLFITFSNASSNCSFFNLSIFLILNLFWVDSLCFSSFSVINLFFICCFLHKKN